MTESSLVALFLDIAAIWMDMATVLLRFVVIYQELAILAIPARLDLGLVHDCKYALPALDLVENAVHFLKGTIGCLGVEEVHGRHHECVDHREDGVGLILDVVEGNRSNHHDEKVEDLKRAR